MSLPAAAITTTCTHSGLGFEVSYEHDPEIKGGMEEEPVPEYFAILHAKYNGAEFIEMLNKDVLDHFEQQIRGTI